MKTLSKENLNQMANEMTSYEPISTEGRIYIRQDGTLVNNEYKFTGKETHVVVMPGNASGNNTGIAIEIPQGMQCELKKGPNVNGEEKEWLIFDNTESGSKKIFNKEFAFFKELAHLTDVEWALATNSKSGGGKLFTSFSSSGADASPAYSGGYDRFYHNHVSGARDSLGRPLPLNDYDRDNCHNLTSKYDYEFFIIYTEENKDEVYYW